MKPYRVNTEDLLNFAVKLQKFGERAEAATNDADKVIAALHELWTGTAAAAHREHHDKWTKAAAEMHEALDDLRKAAHTAHTNYTGVAQHNVDMWPKA